MPTARRRYLDRGAHRVHTALRGGATTIEARKQILVEQYEEARARLALIRAGIDRLDYKIAHYDELMPTTTSSTFTLDYDELMALIGQKRERFCGE